MQLLGLLTPLLGFIAFAAFVWLVVVAFKNSAMWGVLVLLLSPITAIVFAIKYWEESKKPFLIYMGSTVASVVIFFMFLASMGSQMISIANEMELQAQQQGTFGDTQTNDMEYQPTAEMPQAAPAPVADNSNFSLGQPGAKINPPAPMKPAGITLSVKSDAPEFSTRERISGMTPLSRAARVVGKKVKIVDNKGSVHKGWLAESKPNALVLERHVPSGVISYEVRKNEVKSLEVLYR